MKNIEKLFHISRNTDIIEKFIPRIPESRADWEDEINQRVCLSSSIEGCLTGVPWGGSKLEDILLPTGDGSYLIRVYEFDIKNIATEDLVGPEEIYEDGLVNDAMLSQEYWFIGKELKPDRTYLIELSGYLEQVVDIYSYESERYILMNEDSITDEDMDELRDHIAVEIYEAMYKVVSEEKRSGIIKRRYRAVGKIDTTEALTEIEDIFGYNQSNEIVQIDDYVELNIDTRNHEINIKRFDGLIESLLFKYIQIDEAS